MGIIVVPQDRDTIELESRRRSQHDVAAQYSGIGLYIDSIVHAESRIPYRCNSNSSHGCHLWLGL